MRNQSSSFIADILLTAVTPVVLIAVVLGAMVSFIAIIMKLTGAIGWSWWQVLSPVAIPFATEVIEAIVVAGLLLISDVFEEKKDGDKM